MKAIVYVKRGTPDPFIYCDVSKPIPGDGEVLIKIHAASLNAADYRLFRMGLGIPKSKIFGSDIAGTVEAVGKNIRTFQPGDNVAADTGGYGFGGLAEYAVAPGDIAALIPAEVSFEKAAAVPMAAITALQALRDKGSIRQGQKVLINGASGGVGTYAVQLAKHFGAEVTAVCSTGNADLVRSLGADHVIDYAKEDFTQSGTRYDLIIAVNGYHPLSAYKRALAPEGTYVMVGGTFPQIFKSLIFGPLMSAGKRKIRSLAAKGNAKDLAFLLDLVKEGIINPVIDRRYPLRQAGEAFLYLEKGHAGGKVVINVIEGSGIENHA